MPERVPFRKPALSLEQQIFLLEQRGLIFGDKALAERHLANISYYRLSGYTRYFLDPATGEEHSFKYGTTFERVLDLYIFDRKLRGLLSDALERIEIATKGAIAYHGALLHGPFWVCEPHHFDHGRHDDIMELVREACAPARGSYKQLFLESFFKKYSDPIPPVWMISEVLSFHGASMLFKCAKGAIRLPVASQFAVQHDVLESWLHSLVFTRNVCAHHMRLWNRVLTIKPKIPKEYRNQWPDSSRDKIYITCCIINHLLRHIGGDTTWPTRLRELVSARPAVPLAAMGFPDDWEQLPNWADVLAR